MCTINDFIVAYNDDEQKYKMQGVSNYNSSFNYKNTQPGWPAQWYKITKLQPQTLQIKLIYNVFFLHCENCKLMEIMARQGTTYVYNIRITCDTNINKIPLINIRITCDININKIPLIYCICMQKYETLFMSTHKNRNRCAEVSEKKLTHLAHMVL